MTALEWNRLPDGSAELASGEDWAYLIAGRPGRLVLTRYRPLPNMSATDAAVQGALHAMNVHADRAPAPVGADLANARRLAQEFEDGRGLFLVPNWQHEPATQAVQPAGRYRRGGEAT